MMTVEGRELPQPPQGAAHQKAYSLLCPLDSPHHSTVPGDSHCLWDLHHLLALLRCLRAPCHLVDLSLLALLAPFAMALSLSIPPAQPNSTGPPHSAQLPRPNSLGPTLLARPNSLGPTHLAQFYSLGPTHSAQLTRPDSPNSTHSARLTRPNSFGLTHSPQLIRPNPAHLVPLSQPSSLNLPCDQLTGWPTNQPPTLWDHVLPEPSCISLQSTHLNEFVVTGGGVM